MTEPSKTPRVGLLATHPVQYYAPWYSKLAEAVDLEVFYSHLQTREEQARAGFGVAFDWDVPLLSGYAYRFLPNRARNPNVSSFFGCDSPDIAQIIRRGAFDAFIVHGWANLSFWQAIIACWRTRTPILVRGDAQLTSQRPRYLDRARRSLHRTFIPRFDAYLVVGQRAREYYVHYGAQPERMYFSPHAVDNHFFETTSASLRPRREHLRENWGIPSDATVFLFVGKLIDVKRPFDFVQAVALAARNRPSVWGLVVGDGELRRPLESHVRHFRWPIRFAGFLNQTQIPQAYACSDALILPSRSETWGLVVNEAMASGLPAIVSDQVGCGPDLVQSSQTGEIFACGSVAELATIMERLVGPPSSLPKLALQARHLVQRYSLSEAVKGTLAAIEFVQRGRLQRRNID